MKSRLGRVVFALFLGLSMVQVTGCATGAKERQSSYVKKSGKNLAKQRRNQRQALRGGGNYSLFTKQEMNYRILRQGKRARYSNSLDNY